MYNTGRPVAQSMASELQYVKCGTWDSAISTGIKAKCNHGGQLSTRMYNVICYVC